ncbi:PDR/VanB family oxidoreductase [Nocardia aurea]|uniref:PDR/VanB family oxidoreductase n=1 Tax=Nocardia aurea TaxID=2144174 RepID=UPI000D694AC7
MLEVSSRITKTSGVVEIGFRVSEGHELPPWSPGAHIDVFVADGSARQYSLTGYDRSVSTWRIAVLREPDGRGGSNWIHDHVAPGDRVRVRGPRNHFPLHPSPRYVFIAGGIGITPILPMVAEADRTGADWHLYYCGRSSETMAFTDELASFGDRVSFFPREEHGRLDLEKAIGHRLNDTLIYCCGPEPLLDAIRELSSRWNPGALRVEHFTPPKPVDTGEDQPVEVELRASQLTLEVPAGTSILRAVADAGIHVISSCSEGICGSCETPVIEGTIDHRDAVLSDEERAANDTMMICVSRPRCGRLVLDL